MLVQNREDADLMMSPILLKRAIDTLSSKVCREAFDRLWYVSECIIEDKIAPLLCGQKEALYKGFTFLSLQGDIIIMINQQTAFEQIRKVRTGNCAQAELFAYHGCEVSCDKNHNTCPKRVLCIHILHLYLSSFQIERHDFLIDSCLTIDCHSCYPCCTVVQARAISVETVGQSRLLSQDVVILT